jgi:hypothetical protein
LLVDGADERALAVVEHGTVDRAGHVILSELAFGADVDHLVKIGQLCYGDRERPAGFLFVRGRIDGHASRVSLLPSGVGSGMSV